MSPRNFNAQQAGCAADVAEGFVLREIKLLRKRLEIDAREPGHCPHELLQPRQIRVEFLKHPLLPVLDLILRTPRPQRPDRRGASVSKSGSFRASRSVRPRASALPAKSGFLILKLHY